jgi:hypothetical protein
MSANERPACRLASFLRADRFTPQFKLLGKPVPSVRSGVQGCLLLGRVDKLCQSKAVLSMSAELLTTRHDRPSRLFPLTCAAQITTTLGVCTDHASPSVSDCSHRPAKSALWETLRFSLRREIIQTASIDVGAKAPSGSWRTAASRSERMTRPPTEAASWNKRTVSRLSWRPLNFTVAGVSSAMRKAAGIKTDGLSR